MLLGVVGFPATWFWLLKTILKLKKETSLAKEVIRAASPSESFALTDIFLAVAVAARSSSVPGVVYLFVYLATSIG